MGYMWVIERPAGSLRREEWDRLVASRGDFSAPVGEVPRAQDVVVWRRGDDDDAEEVWFTWLPSGVVAVDVDIATDHRDLLAIAGELDAQLRGESGEIVHPDGTFEEPPG